jgi:2-methylisocitrate lyase-like PEP mutase family enzyme
MKSMTKEHQSRLAEELRRRHHVRPLLLLANAWDPMSARVFESAGFDAIATTSGGVAWALGFPDGEQAPWKEVVAATARIARCVRVPVTADIEGGYGASPGDVARSVTDIIRAGAEGINLEDSTHHADMPVRSSEDAVARIVAAREAGRAEGVPLVINARIDLYHKKIGDDATRFAETVRRGKAYLAAGADCIFPFGLSDLKVVAELVEALGAPVNIVGRRGMPDTGQLERLGIARVSTASGPSLAAMSAMRKIAQELHKGQFDVLDTVITRADAQQMFAARPVGVDERVA